MIIGNKKKFAASVDKCSKGFLYPFSCCEVFFCLRYFSVFICAWSHEVFFCLKMSMEPWGIFLYLSEHEVTGTVAFTAEGPEGLTSLFFFFQNRVETKHAIEVIMDKRRAMSFIETKSSKAFLNF